MNPTANYQTQPSYELNPVASQPKASSTMSEYYPSGSGWTGLPWIWGCADLQTLLRLHHPNRLNRVLMALSGSGEDVLVSTSYMIKA